VDIDPRCAQIAALALWLRAQRAWKDIGVATSETAPHPSYSHCGGPSRCPAKPSLVDEFAARLDPPLLRDLFKKMVSEKPSGGRASARCFGWKTVIAAEPASCT